MTQAIKSKNAAVKVEEVGNHKHTVPSEKNKKLRRCLDCSFEALTHVLENTNCGGFGRHGR